MREVTDGNSEELHLVLLNGTTLLLILSLLFFLLDLHLLVKFLGELYNRILLLGCLEVGSDGSIVNSLQEVEEARRVKVAIFDVELNGGWCTYWT